MARLDKLKNVFQKLGSAKQKQEPETVATPERPAAPGKDDAPAQTQQETVTFDMVISAMDTCKAHLIKTSLAQEQISQYTQTLDLMQQMMRGRHANTDISDLLAALKGLFEASLEHILRYGTAEDCADAIDTITKAIQHVSSNQTNDVTIAALKLHILIQQANILCQQKVISDLEKERTGYIQQQLALMANIKLDAGNQLPDQEKYMRLNHQVMSCQKRIEIAGGFIKNWESDIDTLRQNITTIQTNPYNAHYQQMQQLMVKLREGLMTDVEIAARFVEEAKEVEQRAAQSEAELNVLYRAVQEHQPIVSQDIQEQMRESYEALHASQTTSEETQQVQDTPSILNS
ncbi:MAG: hypothetical protein ACI4MJ_11275 [Aristaeellaceae bacterium]